MAWQFYSTRATSIVGSWTSQVSSTEAYTTVSTGTHLAGGTTTSSKTTSMVRTLETYATVSQYGGRISRWWNVTQEFRTSLLATELATSVEAGPAATEYSSLLSTAVTTSRLTESFANSAAVLFQGSVLSPPRSRTNASTTAATTRSSYSQTIGTTITSTSSSITNSATASNTTDTQAGSKTVTLTTSTVTNTKTLADFATTTATRSFTYPKTTAPGATASTFSIETYTTKTAATLSINTSTTQTATSAFPALIDTMVEAETTDWAWSATTTGSEKPSVVGASFTRTTFSETETTTTLGVTPLTLLTSETKAVTTGTRNWYFTFASQTYGTTSFTTSFATTTTESYQVAEWTSTNETIPFGQTTRTVTFTHTTTASASFTYSSSATTSSGINGLASRSEGSVATTKTDTVTTSYSGGTVTTTLTWTLPTNRFTSPFTSISNASLSNIFSTGSDAFGTSTTSRGASMTAPTMTLTWGAPSHSSFAAAAPSFFDSVVSAGWEALPNLGAQKTWGTNIAGGPGSIEEVSCIWGSSLSTPVMDTAPVAFTIGTDSYASEYDTSDSKVHVTQTVTTTAAPGTTTTILAPFSVSVTGTKGSFEMTFQTTQFGGFGWDSTRGSTATQTRGVARGTKLDSTGGTTTTEQSWGAASTLSIPRGNAIALEPVPTMNSQLSSDEAARFAAFSAFPVT